MSLTRKRQKALKRLRSSAEELWLDQQAVLDRANHVAHEARLQLGELTKEEVVPRVKTATKNASQTWAQNLSAAKDAGEQARSKAASAGEQARKKLNKDILPAVGGSIASAADALKLNDNPTVKKALAKTLPTQAKKSSHVGAYVLVVTGAVALVGLGYAVWQTFRADDELWISEDEIDSAPTS